MTAVRTTGLNRASPAWKAACFAAYPFLRNSLKVSINTMLLFTTTPASAMIPRPDMTIPNGLSIIQSPKNTPPDDRIMADIVTIVCQAELNCSIKTSTIRHIDSAKDEPRKACVSAISSDSPPKITREPPAICALSISACSVSIIVAGNKPSSTSASIK